MRAPPGADAASNKEWQRSKFGDVLAEQQISGTATGSASLPHFPISYDLNLIFFTHRGVAQLVARELWELDAAGSSPVTSTNQKGACPPFCIGRMDRNEKMQWSFRFCLQNDGMLPSRKLLKVRTRTFLQSSNPVASTIWALRAILKAFFFDYSDAKFECWIVKAMDITAHRFYCIDLTILIFWLIDTLDCSNFRVILQAHLLLSLNLLPLRSF